MCENENFSGRLILDTDQTASNPINVACLFKAADKFCIGNLHLCENCILMICIRIIIVQMKLWLCFPIFFFAKLACSIHPCYANLI